MSAGVLPVAVVGLGVMGEPIARNLLRKSGRPVRVFDTRPEVTRRVADLGASVAPTLSAAAEGAEVVFVSLPSGAIVEKVARQPDGLLQAMQPGAVFVDLGTSSVALTRLLAKDFAARGLGYLDAPVARTRQAAEAGTLSVMVGGEIALFDRLAPLFACFATDVTHCGPTGSGQAAKILNNMVMFQTVEALCEAYGIARAAGFDPEVVFGVLQKGSGDSFALRNHGAKAIIPQEFPLRAFSVEYARKDLSYALELAAEHHVDVPGARHIDALFARAIDRGLANHYFPVISRLLQQSGNGE